MTYQLDIYTPDGKETFLMFDSEDRINAIIAAKKQLRQGDTATLKELGLNTQTIIAELQG